MNNEKEQKLLYLQLIATTLFLITVLISLYITYELIVNDNNKENEKKLNILSYKSRIIATISILLFFYITIENYKISKEQNKSDLNIQRNELIISILTVISGIISLYNATQRTSSPISDTENPDI